LKILHIAPTPFFSDRGCHIRILNIVQALAHHNTRNTLCTYHHGRDRNDVKIHRAAPVPGYTETAAGPQKGKLRADLHLLALSFRIARQQRPDIIHAHLHEGLLIGWLVRILLAWRRIPLVVDIQGGLVGELQDHGYFAHALWRTWLLKPALRFLEFSLLRLPSHIFCSSANSQALCRDDYGVPSSRLTLLDDRVDINTFTKCRHPAKLPFSDDAKIVVYSGSLLPIKGTEHLKTTVLELVRRRNDVCFLLVGYPTEDLDTFRRTQQLSERIHLEGRVSFDELPAYLLAADVAVDPKVSESGEGSGKLLHYMAAGLPVAAFPTAHHRQILGQAGDGKPEDPHYLADRIEALLADEAERRRIGERNRRLAAEYSLSSAGRLIRSIYGHIVRPDVIMEQASDSNGEIQ